MLEHHHDPVQQYRLFDLPVRVSMHVDGPNVEIYMQIRGGHNYIGNAPESHRYLERFRCCSLFPCQMCFSPTRTKNTTLQVSDKLAVP